MATASVIARCREVPRSTARALPISVKPGLDEVYSTHGQTRAVRRDRPVTGPGEPFGIDRAGGWCCRAADRVGLAAPKRSYDLSDDVDLRMLYETVIREACMLATSMNA